MDIFNFIKESENSNIENIQIKETTSFYNETEIINDKLIDYTSSSDITYDIKALYNNKTVNINTDYLDDSIIKLIKEKATIIESEYQDIYLTDTTNNNETNTEIAIDIKNKIKEIKELDKIRKEFKYVTKATYNLISKYKKIRIINNNGVDISSDNTNFSFYIQSVATKEKEIVKSKYDSILKVKLNDINIEEIMRKSFEQVILLLNEKKLETKKYNILLTPSVNSNILSHIIDMINKRTIREHISIMENKLNKKIFSDKLTLLEEPTNINYPGYRLFDDEGTKTYDKTIIEDGVLKTNLFNNQEAIESNTISTGNSYNGISTRNMYMKPNTKTYEDLIKELDNGIIITDFMGSTNTAISSVTGQISIQVFGFIVENKKIVSGFTPAILTTDIFELYSNIKDIGNDLTFDNTVVGSPSILIENISIAS